MTPPCGVICSTSGLPVVIKGETDEVCGLHAAQLRELLHFPNVLL